MPTAEDVLTIARTELGTAESPAGSNKVKYNTWYYGKAVSGDDYPWCAVFVSWVAQTAGALDAGIIPKHAYTPSGAKWFQDRGAWGSAPRVGAIAFYEFSGMGRISHVGIVETVNADGSWVAIEGNTDGNGSRTGGIVMRQRRSSVGQRGGFGYPAYAGAAAPTPTAPVATTTAALTVDGDLGPATIKALQRALGTTVDGVISRPRSEMVQVLQRKLNTALDGEDLVVDGDLGTKTVRALQRYLGTTVDGVISRPRSSMVEALQRRLNEGRF